jgi:hypothetical protein
MGREAAEGREEERDGGTSIDHSKATMGAIFGAVTFRAAVHCRRGLICVFRLGALASSPNSGLVWLHILRGFLSSGLINYGTE